MVTPKLMLASKTMRLFVFAGLAACASPTDLRRVEALAAQQHQRSLGIFFTKFLFLFPLQIFTIY